ncbi:MAG: DUF177 domain-containing protein [Alphaproteobacteria bacterium]|nr:DUF177 domain-containing protein [Alphaproteobacteria bacterium]OJV45351.1 MAG: hypothetical protein BGO28_00915 [Alphaproteobacteria bacterium 43-37]
MITSEFSRTVSLDTILDPTTIHFEATADECIALSKRLQVCVHNLVSDVTIEPSVGGKSHMIQGKLTARLEQTCAVTLEPIQNNITATFKVFFTPHVYAETIIMEDEDQEFYDDPAIDIGEIIAQYLCLNIDQAPRQEGAVIANEESAPAEEPKNKPFANLNQKLGLDKK